MPMVRPGCLDHHEVGMCRERFIASAWKRRTKRERESREETQRGLGGSMLSRFGGYRRAWRGVDE
jgi:hypothetical protein